MNSDFWIKGKVLWQAGYFTFLWELWLKINCIIFRENERHLDGV